VSNGLYEIPPRPVGVIRPTIEPNAEVPMFEACCRLCDTVSFPGVISEIETWLYAHLRSKHNREPDGRRVVRSGTEDWPVEVKR
jgi:hypothetical protein